MKASGRESHHESIAVAEEDGIKAQTAFVSGAGSSVKEITNYANKSMIDLIPTGTEAWEVSGG